VTGRHLGGEPDRARGGHGWRGPGGV